jgi:Immunoglobulin domain
MSSVSLPFFHDIEILKLKFHSPVPPDILDYPTSTDMVVREGSNVTLKCAARGSPTPNITWRREGSEPIAVHGGREGK